MDGGLPGARLLLPIEGMTCAACAGRVERALARAPGVAAVAVNLAAATARVDLAPGADPAALSTAVADAGYAVARRTLAFTIEGMTCAACAGRVERALRALPGVEAARVSLATARAEVDAPGGVVAPRDVVAAVARAGYGARPVVDGAVAAPAERWIDGAPAMTAALALAAPFAVDMVNHLLDRPSFLPPALQLALALPLQTVFAWPFYRAAWKGARAGAATMDTLVALGTSAAFILSLAVMAGWLPGAGGHAAHGAPALYFEASAMVIALVRLGRWIETRAKRATVAAIEALRGLRPAVARVRRDGVEVEVAIGSLAVDDVVVARPGEDVAVDGVVVDGRASVSEAVVTGESRPVSKSAGDLVIAGSTTLDGALDIRATAVGDATRTARIARAVAEAQTGKMPVEALVDRVTRVFVPAILALSVAAFAGWMAAGASAPRALVVAMTVLVVACPCALGLATPMAIAVGLGAAARRGILIRVPAAIERLARVRTVAFDKTGTLTAGRPVVTALLPAAGVPEATLLLATAAAQAGSEHPLARAIKARAAGLALPPARDFHAVVGRGVTAVVDGADVAVGGRALMREGAVDISALETVAAAHEAVGATVVFAARGGVALGCVAIADAARPTSRDAVAALRRRGVEVAMITGDSEPTARAVAAGLDIAVVLAARTPEGKAADLAGFKRAGGVAMVGDGINDAPALAAADVGVAMGGGADLALGAADVALLRDDPALVAELLDLARRIRGNIVQNLAWAFGYNVVAVPLAMLGALPPALAGAAMAGSSVAVVLNALRLRRAP